MDFSQIAALAGPMQQAMAKADGERTSARIEGRAGGGAVVITLSGDPRVERIVIAPAAAADPGILEDLIHLAMNDALATWRKRFGGSPQEQMQRLMAGADLGALMSGLKR